MPRSSRGAVRQLQQRRMAWIRLTRGLAVGVDGFAIDLLADFRVENGGAQPLGLTITRTRLVIQTTADGAGNSNQGTYFGMYVGSKDLDPATMPRPPEFLHEDYMAFGFIPRSNGGGANTIFSDRMDVKAQRRMDELGQTVWLVGTVNGLTLPADVLVVSSMLVKLP